MKIILLQILVLFMMIGCATNKKKSNDDIAKTDAIEEIVTKTEITEIATEKTKEVNAVYDGYSNHTFSYTEGDEEDSEIISFEDAPDVILFKIK